MKKYKLKRDWERTCMAQVVDRLTLVLTQNEDGTMDTTTVNPGEVLIWFDQKGGFWESQDASIFLSAWELA